MIYRIEDEYLSVEFSDLGGRITSIRSAFCDFELVLGYSEESAYYGDDMYLGAIIGRYANRIGGAAFELGGKKYELDKNDGENCLHGGFATYANKRFAVSASHSTALLTLEDPHGAFPGDVKVKVKYSVIGSSFIIQYQAECTENTFINLTNHTYFAHNGDIKDCVAYFDADSFTPVDQALIPTGEIRPVAGTVFDFTYPRYIGDGIDSDDVQISYAGGYDHNFVINGSGIRRAASVYMPVNDMTVSVTTNAPGIQFYTGNFIHEPKEKREAFCLETQYFPDTPNKPGFPQCLCSPEKPFRSKTIYSFAKGKTF